MIYSKRGGTMKGRNKKQKIYYSFKEYKENFTGNK